LRAKSLLFILAAYFCSTSLLAETKSAQTTVHPETVEQWHTITLFFSGPDTSESAETNPFTDYRLQLRFTHAEVSYEVRGFYAADGNAAESGAEAGNIWQARFSPDRPGTWNWVASLRTGDGIAVLDDHSTGEAFALADSNGSFKVVAARSSQQRDARDFRLQGRVISDGHYFRFGKDGPYLLKGGANSPENLLAMVDFDNTYRMQEQRRDGEASSPGTIHSYPTHVADWQAGDPVWQGGKGKALIGAINYLASTGMNAAYFLTLNIEGDGRDVWPYADPADFTRFDCSKLDQWEIVFEHMQRRGIMLHIVTQETENELMLDQGETGFLRKLYYRELISRFAHHPALVWNLGEENGPASFSPLGQTAEQQKAMATYMGNHDPYGHPLLIHTHSIPEWKDGILSPLLGHQPLDGLSFQVDNLLQVHDEVVKWRQLAIEAGRPWLITMDEIGQWHTGAVTDIEDPGRDSLRHHVLWGSLLAGAAGVEWYFGARHPHNDLASEDWRQRENLWTQTRQALKFFEKHLPYWEMKATPGLLQANHHYTFAKPGKVYAIYLPGQSERVTLDLETHDGEFQVSWYDPILGGELQTGDTARLKGSGRQSLGRPPRSADQDWVVLVKRIP
jgi:hypothetical protein